MFGRVVRNILGRSAESSYSPKEIQKAVGEAEKLSKRGDDTAAIEVLLRAWQLFPEPGENCHDAISIAGSLGHLYADLGQFAPARERMERALLCPGGVDNASVHLRLGEALFQLGERERGVG